MSHTVLPSVLFAFNRPVKLRRVLDALRPQGVERLVIFVDGPRRVEERAAVEACRALARDVDWAQTELHLWEDNRGLNGLLDNVSLVFEQYEQAVFIEDDCLPKPGFYDFMRRALERYKDTPQVFSIGGYQYLGRQFFEHYPADLVSCARFSCWGWATWRDRWQEVLPPAQGFRDLFNGLQHVPQIAGDDLPEAMRLLASEQAKPSWAFKVALASLALKKVHLLPTGGLVRNMGVDRSGVHGGLLSALRDRRLHNRNLAQAFPAQPRWLEDVRLDLDYAVALKDFIRQAQGSPLRRAWQRGRTAVRRYLLPGKERYLNLNLAGIPEADLPRRALFSYIVHPFAIPRSDPRFLRHINIWHAQEMVRVLNRMGYCVDVIDYRDTGFRPRRAYDLFIGHGGVNFEQICRDLPAATPKIYFSTGAYWQFHNRQEAERFADLRRRRGVELPQDRYIQHSEETALRLADGILGIGGDFTRQTYADFPQVAMINGTSLFDDTLEWCGRGDPAQGRNHFFFFSGGGNVHKGLDLLLEAFDGLEQHLWIGTNIEAAFERAYARELHELPNVHLLGYVQPRGAAFYRTMRRCNFCLLPSCSEGQSQAVVEAMNQGLIPLVSRAAGVEVDGIGTWIEPCTVDGVRAVVRQASAWSVEECLDRSGQARRAAQNEYSEAAFEKALRAALEGLLL